MAQMKARISSLAIACLLATAAWADEPRAGGDAREVPAALLGEVVRLSGPSFATSDEPLIGKVMAVDAEAMTVVRTKRVAETLRLVGVDADASTVVPKRAAETVRVPFSSIKRLEVARLGRRSRAGEGALIGMAIPVAAAVLISARSSHGGGGDMGDLGPIVEAYYLAFAVPTAGLIGAAIGSQFHGSSIDWERVPTRRVRVSVLPDFHGGIRGGLSVRF